MAKYSAVDRLMDMATGKATAGASGSAGSTPAAQDASSQPSLASHERRAEEVLEEQVARKEPGRERSVAASAPLPLHSPTPAVDRGRQLLSALRPFLPVVGGALRMVDHGGAQALARVLPLLGGMAGAGATAAGAAGAEVAGKANPLSEGLAALEKRQGAGAEELKALTQRAVALEDQQRRMREILERTAAEQNAQSHQLREIKDRMRLLTAGVIILLMLVGAEMVLSVILLHYER